MESVIIPKNRLKEEISSNHYSFNRFIRIIITFVFVSIAWVFFRAETINDAFFVLSNAFLGISSPWTYVKSAYSFFGFDTLTIILIPIWILILCAFDYKELHTDVIAEISKWNPVLRWSIYILLVVFILIFHAQVSTSEFIYYQF